MDRIKLYCRGVCCAHASVTGDGGRVLIEADMRDPGDGLYRAVLRGARGDLPLGVMEAKDGKLLLRRRPERCEVERLGELRCVDVQCAFLFGGKQLWQLTRQPQSLFRSDFLRSRLLGQPWARWRREQGRLAVAFPFRTDGAFPLETIFCLGRVERVDGELCVVYIFDEEETPLLPG